MDFPHESLFLTIYPIEITINSHVPWFFPGFSHGFPGVFPRFSHGFPRSEGEVPQFLHRRPRFLGAAQGSPGGLRGGGPGATSRSEAKNVGFFYGKIMGKPWVSPWEMGIYRDFNGILMVMNNDS